MTSNIEVVWDQVETFNLYGKRKTKIIKLYKNPSRYDYLDSYTATIKCTSGELEVELTKSDLKLTNKHRDDICLLTETSVFDADHRWTYTPIRKT